MSQVKDLDVTGIKASMTERRAELQRQILESKLRKQKQMQNEQDSDRKLIQNVHKFEEEEQQAIYQKRSRMRNEAKNELQKSFEEKHRKTV